MESSPRPIGIVIPWFSRDARGGAELHAWELASRLAARGHAIEVITTCCRAYTEDWATNHLPPGVSPEPEGFLVRRFAVTARDRAAFDQVNGRLLAIPKAGLRRGVPPLGVADQDVFADELMRSPDLLQHLADHGPEYGAIIFLPYLYFTSLRGLPLVADRSILIPCLHHEAYAFLPLVTQAFSLAQRILFISEGEARLASWLFGPGIATKSAVAGGGVDPVPPSLSNSPFDTASLRPFVLCLGRQDAGKNTDLLAAAYAAYRHRHPETSLKLVLAGPGSVPLPDDAAGISNLGAVPPAVKDQLLAECIALFNPSVNESYSRVIMEVWHMGRPVAAHRDCLATSTAVLAGNGGWTAGPKEEWIELFDHVANAAPDELARLGENGRSYAQNVGSWSRALDRYEEAIRAVAAGPAVAPPASRGAIHQVLANVAFGDAISNEALWIKRTLARSGYESKIYSLHVDPRLEGEVSRWQPGCLDHKAAVIYHHSIGSAVTNEICTHPGPRALIYHNITPPSFLEPYLPLNSQLCREGRKLLPQLARYFSVSVGDSICNAIELAESSFADPGVLPLCIDPEQWDLPPDSELMRQLQDGRTNILFVGRLSPNKRQEDLLVAFAHYRKLDPTARLNLVGAPVAPEDFYLACLRRLAEELGLADSVTFAGEVNSAELQAYYRTAHLFWSMSEHEGFCVPLIEAMWFDVPVLACGVCAVPETLNGAGRQFLRKEDPAALAREAFTLVHNHAVRDEVLNSQRTRRRDFLPAQIEPHLLRLVGKLDQLQPAKVVFRPPPPALGEIREIAVVKLDHIGDLLLASPVFYSLKRRFSGARITAIVAPASAPVLWHNPHVDRVIPYDPPWFWRDVGRIDDLGERQNRNWEHAAQMAATRYDLVVNLRSDHANVLFAASLPHRHLLSYTNDSPYAFLISHPLTRTRGMHASRQHRELLRTIDADAWCAPKLHFTADDLARAQSIGAPTKNTVVLALGAGFPLKRWAPIKFRELARRLLGRGLTVAIVGTAADLRLSEEWDAPLGCVNLCGRFNLHELAAYLSQTGCLVANDSAPMHIGAAAGIPVVYIIRPPVREEFAPVGARHTECALRSCAKPCKGFDPNDPLDSREFCQCIQAITVDEVEAGVLHSLEPISSGASAKPEMSLGASPAETPATAPSITLPVERRLVRILVDLTHLQPGGHSGGIKPAIYEIIRWLGARQDPPLAFVLVARDELHAEIARLLRPGDRLVCTARPIPDLAAQELCDVVYCPFGITDFACPGIPTVTLIVDLLHRDCPGTLTEADRLYRERRFAEAVACTDWYQVISEHTADRLVHHYSIPRQKIVRTYLPLHHRLTTLIPASYQPPATPFFFFPANAWAHKNHETLLAAYATYHQTEGARAWLLLLTGNEDDRMQQVRRMAAQLQLESKVQFLGYVDDTRLAELWTTASALVFPSLHEGFGLPLLEAMAFGVPVIASNSSAVTEIVGSSALLVDARNPAELAHAMIRIARDTGLRTRLAALGLERASEFSPDAEFDRLYQVLVASSPPRPRYQRRGYYDVDGLTDPLAIFALPKLSSPIELSVALRPLPAHRHLQLWSGPDLVGELQAAALSAPTAQFRFAPRFPAVTLKVLDANRLCETDPRTHGVLIESLRAATPDGAIYDLLSPAAQVPA